MEESITKNNCEVILPFLKWAGGKRWLIDSFPELFQVEYDRYIEPFLGSAAVYFHMKPEKAILADLNQDLINAYQCLKNKHEKVHDVLKTHHRLHGHEYYYEMRNRRCTTSHTRAAKFIYLNRTCWNGLYRVNLKGEFNVPKGTKSNVILSSDDFIKVSDLLSNADIKNNDYSHTISLAKSGDLLFVDPPYTVKHNYNGFIKYNEKLFSWNDQVRLSEMLIQAKKRGVKIISTNACHELVKDLYRNDFELWEVERYSHMSASNEFRKPCEELLILG